MVRIFAIVFFNVDAMRTNHDYDSFFKSVFFKQRIFYTKKVKNCFKKSEIWFREKNLAKKEKPC